jgi:membrane protease YdiL (CAAX protease family)
MASRARSLISGVGLTLFPPVVRQIFAPIILLILLLFFFVNGQLVFGTLWNTGNMPFVISAYLFIALAAFVVSPALDQIKGGPIPPQKLFVKPPSLPLWAQAIMYVGAALAINIPMYIAGARQQSVFTSLTAGNFVALVALQVSVSGAEELFFRGALFRAGWFVSSLTFGAFHALVYGVALWPLIFAVIAAVAFYFVYAITKDRFGLAANTGMHLGYNLGLLGVSLIPVSLIMDNPIIHFIIHVLSGGTL